MGLLRYKFGCSTRPDILLGHLVYILEGLAVNVERGYPQQAKLERGRQEHFPVSTGEPIDSRSVLCSSSTSASTITPHEEYTNRENRTPVTQVLIHYALGSKLYLTDYRGCPIQGLELPRIRATS